MRALLLTSMLVIHLGKCVDAHDTWVETNSRVVRSGDSLYVDLMLGNHGNEHRDFKLANKVDLEKSTLEIIASDRRYDLKPLAIDRGYAPREGFWSAKFVPVTPGLYCVAHQLDTLHKTTRAIKSAKSYFVVSEQLDRVPLANPGHDKPLNHPLEIVPASHPVARMGPGQPISIQLLYQGKPLPNTRVSFIPRGVELTPSFDERYERHTDIAGRAEFVPTEGNYVLVVAHHIEPNQAGDGYDRTSYAATLTVLVPDQCPCCE